MEIKFNAETGEWEIHTRNDNVPVVVEGFTRRSDALRWIDMQRKATELFSSKS